MKTERYAATYFTAGLGTFGCSFLPGVSIPIFLRISGIILLLVCSIFCLYLKVNRPWLQKIVNHLYLPSITFLALFLSVYGFSRILLQANNVIWGLIIVFVAYIVFGYKNGIETGKGLRQVFDKLNIFIPSEKIPKDI